MGLAEIINILGDALAKKIGLSTPASRGLIKLAIMDEHGPFKSIDTLNFDDFALVIKNSLHERLSNLEIQNLDNIIKKLHLTLIKNQSLISISKV